jgi:hypothetical protein
MTKQEQIETTKELIEAIKQLSGIDYRSAWQKEIDKGEQLLQHLQAEAHLHPATKQVKKPLHWLYDRFGINKNVVHDDRSKVFNIRQCAQYISEYIKYLQSIKQ